MQRLKKGLLALKEIFLNTLFPPAPLCPLCGRPAEANWLCTNCTQEISSYPKQEFCRKCGKIVGIAGTLLCTDCQQGASYPFQLARGVGPYQGLIKDTLYRFKYTGQQGLAQVMGMLMSELMMQDRRYRVIEVVTFVPSTPQRLAGRGFNQAELLARQIAQVLGLPIAASLQRIKETPAQAKQGRRERQAQTRGAFQVTARENIVSKSVLLVDDVFTTGSTTSECSKMLLGAGAAQVFVVTWATGVDKYI